MLLMNEYSFIFLIHQIVSVQKWCISPEFKAGCKFKPEEYC
jgi:putative component of membrane protein insertase Oxa1/YidC/SpoIIIJ protein YidD